ncbi:MAG: hypothetical protein Q9160_007786 [Pyrenula sp. 1 TL-2023]
MGRQHFITTLALGRSPYEAPELTEEGDFIYNRELNHISSEAGDYYQQFDDRGRPQNPPQRRAERRIARAQNDVNSTFGIVVSKEQDRKDNEELEKRREKEVAFQEEDEAGLVMQIVDLVLPFQLQWSVFKMRNRYQTFQAFSNLSVTHAFRQSNAHWGPLGTLTAGLPTFWLYKTIETSREMLGDYIVDLLAESKGRLAYIGTQIFKILNITSQIVVEFPLCMLSTLQGLSLAPALAIPYLGYWLPFGHYSPIQRVPLPPLTTDRTFFQASTNLIDHPLILLSIYCFIYRRLMPYFDGFIEELIQKELAPPTISLFAGHRSFASQAGNHPNIFWGAIAKEFSKLHQMVTGLWMVKPTAPQIQSSKSTRRRSFSHLTIEEIDAIGRSSVIYQDEALASAAGYNRAQRRELRLEAHRRAWNEVGIEPPAWLTETMTEAEEDRDSSPSASTATPAEDAEFEAVLETLDRQTGSPDMMDHNADDVPVAATRHLQSTIDGPPPTVETSTRSNRQRTSRMREILDSAEPSDQNQQESASETASDPLTRPRTWSNWSSLIPSRAPSLYPPPPHSPATTPPTSPLLRASLVHHDAETVTMQLEVIQSSTSSASQGQRASSQTNDAASRSDFLGALPDNTEAANLLDAAIELDRHNYPAGSSVRTTIPTDGDATDTAAALEQPVVFDREAVRNQLARDSVRRNSGLSTQETGVTVDSQDQLAPLLSPPRPHSQAQAQPQRPPPLSGLSSLAMDFDDENAVDPLTPNALAAAATGLPPPLPPSSTPSPSTTRASASRAGAIAGTRRATDHPRRPLRNYPRHLPDIDGNTSDNALQPQTPKPNKKGETRTEEKERTSLALFPVTSLSNHLATTLTTLLLLPLESMCRQHVLYPRP